MDALSKYLEESDPDFQQAEYDEERDGFDTSELFRKDGGTHFDTKRINDSMTTSWLDRFDSSVNQTDCHLVTVWIKGNVSAWPWNVEIKRETESLILERLQLKQARRIIPVSGGFVRLPKSSKGCHSFALYLFERFILVWTHDTSTGRTVAVCWNDETWFPRSDFEKVIEQQADLAKHPMYVGYCAATSMMRHHEGDIERNRNAVIGVEARTSHNRFYKNWTAAEGSLAALSAEMSGCAQYLACTVKELDIMREVLDLGMDDEWTASKKFNEFADGALEELRGCTMILKQRLEAQKREIRYVTRRAEVQLTAVFNMITQQETRVSIKVAQDSRTLASATREDSNAMKTLAAVTVVFLPSTFVAALFSTPLFHWSPENLGNSIVTKQFWIFWATSIPLTIVTLGVWAMWIRIQSGRHRDHDLEQRSSLDDDLNRLDRVSKDPIKEE